MITGAHTIIYTTDPEADRAFFRDVLELPNVDAGGGWLIFGLPPAEVAFHPTEEAPRHAFFLLCDDVEKFAARMGTLDVACTAIVDEPWGRLVDITLPGGGLLGVYEARHERPPGPV